MNLCGYCGTSLPGTPGDAVMTAHIESCERHPMSELRRQKTKLAEALKKTLSLVLQADTGTMRSHAANFINDALAEAGERYP